MFVYVPPPPPPSPQAKELGDKITQLILLCREENRDIDGRDVENALRFARYAMHQELGSSSKAPVIAVVLGLLAMLGGLAFFLVQNQQARDNPPWSLIAIVGAAMVVVLLVFLAKARRF